MRVKRKILSLVLCFAVLSTFFPQTVLAEGTHTAYETEAASENTPSLLLDDSGDGYTFENGVLTIMSNEGMTNWKSDAGISLSVITDLVIQGSDISVPSNLFTGWSGLASLEISGSNIKIASSAFSGCSGLITVKIGDGVVSIGSNAFAGCSSLDVLEISGSVKTIDYYAFHKCGTIQTVIFSGSTAPNMGTSDDFLNTIVNTVLVPQGYVDNVGTTFKKFSVTGYELDVSSGELTITSNAGNDTIYYPAEIEGITVKEVKVKEGVTGTLTPVKLSEFGSREINSWQYWNTTTPNADNIVIVESKGIPSKIAMEQSLPRQIRARFSDGTSKEITLVWSSDNPYPENPTNDVYGRSYAYTASAQGYTFMGEAPSTSLQLKIPDVPEGYMTMTMEPLENKTIQMNGYMSKEDFLEELPDEVVLTEKNDSATQHTVPVTWTCSNFSYVNDDSYDYIYFGWDYTFEATSANPEYNLENLLGEMPAITLTAQQTMTEIRVPASWTPQQSGGTWALESSEGYQLFIDGFDGVSCEVGDCRYVYVSDDGLMKVTDKDGKTRYRMNMKLVGDNAENADPNLAKESGYYTIEDYEAYHEEGSNMSMHAAESYLTDVKKGEATFAVMLTIQRNGIKALDIEDGFTFRSQNGSYTFTFKGDVGEGRSYKMSFVDGDTSNTFGYFGKKFFTVNPPDNDRAWAVLLIPDTRLQRWEEQNKNGGMNIDTSWERTALVNFDLGWRFYYDSLFRNSDDNFAATYLSQNVTAVATELTLMPAASNPTTVGKNSETKLAVNADYQYKGISSQVKVWYQWYQCNANGSEATPIEGANSAAYTPETSEDGTTYYYVEAGFEPFEETNSYKDDNGNILQDYDPYGWASDTISRSDIMSLTVGGEESSVTIDPEPWDGTFKYGDKIVFLKITVNVDGDPVPEEKGTVTVTRVDDDGNELGVLGTKEDVSIGDTWSLTYDTSEKDLAVGENKVRITFKGTDGIASSFTEVKVILKAKPVTAEVADESITKVYDGTDTATVNLKIKDEDIISGDTVTVSAPKAKYAQSDAGETIGIELGKLTVSNSYYSVTPPDDITGSITKATLKAEDVNWTYTNSGIKNGSEQDLTDALTYNGEAYTVDAAIEGVKDEEILTLTVTGGESENSAAFTNVGNGSYTFVAALSEIDAKNYQFEADQSPQKKVMVKKAKPDYTVPAGLTATYGETLGDVILPAPENGTWSWKDGNDTSVGNVGDNRFTLVFTPTNTNNYKTVEEQVTISIAARKLSAPSDLQWDGEKATWSTVADADGYLVQLYKDDLASGKPIEIENADTVEHSFTITEAGSYAVEIVAIGTGNYSNSDSKQSNAVLYYSVSVETDGNGSATVNAGNGEKTSDVARAGTTVMLTPAANKDYVFWKWDTGSTELTIEQDETDPGKWSFTMPAMNITVATMFEKIPDAPGVKAVTPDGNEYESDVWTTQDNVTITVSGEDTASGIDYYEYSMDGSSNWTKLDPDTATGKGSWTITDDSQTTYIFRTVTKAGTVGDNSEPFIVKLDKTAPTAEININNDKWSSFLNTVTFGKFFKETVKVTITAGDACSGIQTVEYMLSQKEFSAPDEVDGSWTTLDVGNDGKCGFNIEPKNKGSVYVRVIDNAGITTVINSEGVVVYTDAQKDTQSITFIKLSTTDASFNVTLNGNSVKSLALEKTDGVGQTGSQLIDSENYSVKDGTITLKADYLQSLESGKYTVRVEYDPLGESYIENTDNEAPASTTVELNIQRVAGTVTIDKDAGKIYDGTAVSPVYSTNNEDGEAVVEYKVQGSDDSEYTTAAPKGFGNYTVRVTVKADEKGNYTGASAVQDFEIRKKGLTVNVLVKDKQYDGLDTAQFVGTPELEGVVEGDEVELTSGEPSFDSVEVGNDIRINLTDFTIGGADAGNYYLTQPEGITADIYNDYNAEQGTDYTVNGNEWLNTDFVVTAAKGFSLSSDNKADGRWTDTLIASDETEKGTITFYVRNNTTGAISAAVSENYKIDKTAPTGEIKIGENGWKEFLNTITFGLFFKETQTVSIDSSDTLSGIAVVEYASSETPLTLEEVMALTSWQEGGRSDVIPEDGKRFIYYARITDNAGNVICLSTDGAEYDLTAPVINGISDGGTYCISGEFTVSEKNLKEVQVDGVPATARSAVYTLNPGGHTVTVIDKADNRTQIKVNVNEKHTPEEDDGDCTTAVKCSVCGKVLIQAQEQHDYTYTSNGDGTHTIGCTRCSYSEVEDCAGGTDCKYEKDAVPLVPDNDKTESGEALQTGDDSNYILWIVLLAMSGVSIIGTAIYRRKRKDN